MIKGGKYLAVMAALAMASPAIAGWSLISGKKTVIVTKGKKMKVTPTNDWNKFSYRPTKRSELWTRDGLSLNEVYFLAEVLPGEPLFKQRDKKDEPLPKFKADMLPTDLVDLYEGSARIILRSSKFEVLKVEPAKLGTHDAVRFQYNYVVGDEPLTRKGEVVAANIGGKLYMMSFAAPEIEFFDRDLGEFRDMVSKVVI
jgi:hypothetical protein